MELNCALVKDLLPLYLEELCSEETRRYIEDHLSQCPACRETLRRMRSPLPAPPDTASPDSGMPEEESGAEALPASPRPPRPLNARKVLRRIRRRWFLSLTALLLLIPVGILGVNQVRGYGVSFSTLPQLITAHRFVQAVSDWDIDTGFSLMDLAYQYQQDFESVISGPRSFSQHPMASLQPITLNGETYYVSQWIQQGGPADYTGQDTAELLVSAALSLASPSLGYYFILAPLEYNLLTAQQAELEREYPDEAAMIRELLDSMQSFEIGGQRYYSNAPVAEDPFAFPDITYELLPAACYKTAVEELQEYYTVLDSYARQCETVDFEAYTQESRRTFSSAWTTLKEEGWQLTDWRLIGSVLLPNQCSLQYRAAVTVEGETRELVLRVTTSPDGVLYANFSDDEHTTESYRSLSSLYYIPFPTTEDPS